MGEESMRASTDASADRRRAIVDVLEDRGVVAVAEADRHRRVELAFDGRARSVDVTEEGVVAWLGDRGEREHEVAIGLSALDRSPDTAAEQIRDGLRTLAPGHHLLGGSSSSAWRETSMAEIADVLDRVRRVADGRRVVLEARTRLQEAPTGRAAAIEYARATVAVERSTGSGEEIAHAGMRLDAGVDAFDDLIHAVEQLVDDAEDRATRLRSAATIEPGTYRCRLAPPAAAILLHEIVGHVLERDLFEQLHDLRHVRERLVADASLTVSTVAPDTPGWAREALDAHGAVPAPARDLVRDGRVVSLIGERPGDHRRESWRERPLPRMGRLEFVGGDQAREHDDAQVRIHELGWAALNPRTGVVMAEVAMASTATGPLRGCRLRGSVGDLLRSLSMASGDGQHEGLCLKQGQKLPFAARTSAIVLDAVWLQ